MIKIRLERWETTVLMQVLERDEKFSTPLIFEKDGWEMYASTHPSLGIKVVYLRGSDKEKDLNIAELRLRTVKAAKEYYNNIVKLFEAYNNRDKKDPVDKNIFILE